MLIIEKEAKKPSNYKYPRKYTRSARAAFLHILKTKKQINPKIRILLPAYIGLSKIEGSGVFDPVKEAKVEYEFYRLDNYLKPDLKDLERKINSNDILFIINYFGFIQVTEDILELCHSHGIQIIEDCAHTILGAGYGSFDCKMIGDYAIFSIHKSTSTLDGGFYYDRVGDISFNTLTDDLKISQLTLEEFSNTDLYGITHARSRNYDYLHEQLKGLDEIFPLFGERPREITPLNYPIIVEKNGREKLYWKLIEHGIKPTALYHTLIPEISMEKYPESYFVSNNILNLPTHQDIDEEILSDYCQTIKHCLRG